MTAFFNTTNDFKWEEFELLATAAGVEVKRMRLPVVEINSLDIEEVGRRKVLDVFERWQVPVFVEHGALDIDHFEGLPGPLSEPFWDTLGGKICELLPEGQRKATAKSVVAYCDGRQVRTFTGEVRGSISDAPRGSRLFQWDPIFVANGQDRTFAQMSAAERNEYSQASRAYQELLKLLKGGS